MTRRPLNVLTPLLLLLALPAVAEAGPEAVHLDVFVTSRIDVTGLERLRQQRPGSTIRVHRIDGIAQLKERLGHDLPGDIDQAKRTALQRMQRFGQAERELLQHSADALLLARQYRLRRYPAVVIERRWVIYGVTDLLRALALFQERHEEGGS